jgi:hypothetical protein
MSGGGAQVDMLQHLSTLAKGPVQKIEVLVRVVSSLFDINPSMSTHMAVPLWKRCVATLLEVRLSPDQFPLRLTRWQQLPQGFGPRSRRIHLCVLVECCTVLTHLHGGVLHASMTVVY